MNTSISPQSVIGRVFASGALVLETAAHFGGESSVEGAAGPDMVLLRDANGQPFIPGASIAGAVRAWLRTALGSSVGEPDVVGALFGSAERGQSCLIFDDAVLENNNEPRFTVRDGVRIDEKTARAADQAKFDTEVIEPGARFVVECELVLRKASDKELLRNALDTILQAFADGSVRIGARTRRGLGRCRVDNWRIQNLLFEGQPAAVLAWLARDPHAYHDAVSSAPSSTKIKRLDKRADLEVVLNLDGAVLVGGGRDRVNGPDAAYFRSNGRPLVPGSSIAGVVRHRAGRIVRTLAGAGNSQGQQLVDSLFGFVRESSSGEPATHQASRIIVEESPINGARGYLQSHVRLDRFTGAPRVGFLFDELPVWGGGDSVIVLHFTINEPRDAEIGLLLQIVKDLWTGDLRIGSRAAIGHGRLEGRSATLLLCDGIDEKRWCWEANASGPGLIFREGASADLESFAKAFVALVTEPQQVSARASE